MNLYDILFSSFLYIIITLSEIQISITFLCYMYIEHISLYMYLFFLIPSYQIKKNSVMTQMPATTQAFREVRVSGNHTGNNTVNQWGQLHVDSEYLTIKISCFMDEVNTLLKHSFTCKWFTTVSSRLWQSLVSNKYQPIKIKKLRWLKYTCILQVICYSEVS